MIGQFFIWLLVMHFLHFFFFSIWLHFEHPSVTRTKTFNSVFFFLFSPGAVPVFFFPSLILTPFPVLLLFSSHPHLPCSPCSPPPLHHLSVLFRLQAKAVYLFRQDLFFPLSFLLPHPSIVLTIIIFLFLPCLHAYRESLQEKNG